MTERTLDYLIRNSERNVAVENLGESKIKNLFAGVFSADLFSRLDQRFDVLFKSNKNVHAFKMTSNFDRRIAEWADRESYLSIADVTVYVPVGLKVSYIEYIEALEKALPFLLELEEGLLIPTNQAIGGYVNNPVSLLSKSGLQVKGKLTSKSVDDVTAPISACFDPTVKEDMVKYKQAFRRNGEINDVGQRLLQLQDNVNRIDNKAIERRVRGLFDNAKALSDAMRDDESFDEVRSYNDASGRVTKQLSELLYNAAKWVEFFSIFQYQVMVLSESIADTDKKLKKLSR